MKWRRRLFLLWFCVGVAAEASFSGPEPPSRGATVNVRGIVVESTTGNPLDATHVMLTFYGWEGQPSVVYGAMSNAQGRFSIPDIPPGDYSILPEKRGFIFVPGRKKNDIRVGSLRLRFKATERPYDLVLPMVARAIIAGRVLDETGDPLINAAVTAESVDRDAEASVYTNGRGEFRLSVPPGKYYVQGSRRSASDATFETGYVPTYYPGALGVRDASVVEAFAGRVRNGVEFRLVRAAAFRVSGEITGIPGGDRPVSLWWRSAERITTPTGRESGVLDFTTQQAQATDAYSSVKFYSPPLDAGTYYFYADCCADNEELKSQIAKVTLSDSDMTGVTLSLAPAAEITGAIDITGGPVVSPGQKISVALNSEGPTNSGSRLDAEMGANGSFRINNVFPDRYRLEVGSLLEDAYIRRIEMNGSALHGSLLDFFGGAEGVELKITISPGGSGITGQVRKEKSDAPVSYARVLLFPEHDGPNVDKEECQEKTASASGIYNFQHLRPGRYRFVVRPPSPVRDDCEPAATAMRLGLIAGESIELKAGEKMVKNVHVDNKVSDESRL
jgi:hypothetical protein